MGCTERFPLNAILVRTSLSMTIMCKSGAGKRDRRRQPDVSAGRATSPTPPHPLPPPPPPPPLSKLLPTRRRAHRRHQEGNQPFGYDAEFCWSVVETSADKEGPP